MKNQLTNLLDNLITSLILIVAFATPLLFINLTTEFYDIPKLTFLIISTVVITGLWIFSWILKGKVTITRTPLDIPLLLLLAAVVVSTFFSDSRISAIYGNFPRVHGSAVAWVTYILLYFVTVSNFKKITQVRSFLYVLYASGFIVAALTLLSFFGLFLPFDFARAVNFTPTGSSFSTIAILLLLLPFPLLSIISPNKYLPLPAAIIFAAFFGIVVVLTSSIPSLVVLFITIALCFFVSKRSQVIKALPLVLIPVALIVLTLILSYLPMGSINPIQKLAVNFPKEVQLPLSTSWKISASTFRDAPFIGTGPSSYVFNFNGYKPAEFNSYSFWNFSFDSAYNEVLQIMGTLGIFGMLALISLGAAILLNAWKNISAQHTDSENESMHVLLPSLAVSGILTVLLLLIHAATLVSIVISFMILAALMASQKTIREKVVNLSMGMKAQSAEKHIDLLPVILFIVFLIAAGYVLFNTFNTVSADYYHRQALTQANKNGTLTYQYLQKAESLNPLIDLYRVDMAQTNFALANALVQKKGPSKANPKGTLTDQDKKTIQTLLSQSISEGRVAVVLSPRSSRNWEVLASIYRNITGVAQNALPFSLDAYGQAIQRDPINPALRLSVGGIYYSAKNYNLATRFFTDAANLKPDYANAYFNLAIALRDNGDWDNALLVAQRTVALLAAQSGTKTNDYKVAQALVADLKTKIAAAKKGNKGSTSTTAPAAKTNSALQNQNISNVNVSDLNNPPKTTPAPTVKPNPSTNLPKAATTVTPTIPAR